MRGARFFDEAATVLSRIDGDHGHRPFLLGGARGVSGVHPTTWRRASAGHAYIHAYMPTPGAVGRQHGDPCRRRPACVVEVGSGSSLAPLLAEATSPTAADLSIISTLRHSKIDHAEGMADQLVFGEALGGLWEAGVPVAWGSYNRGERYIKLALPTYALHAFGSTTTRRCTCARLRRS